MVFTVSDSSLQYRSTWFMNHIIIVYHIIYFASLRQYACVFSLLFSLIFYLFLLSLPLSLIGKSVSFKPKNKSLADAQIP